MGPALLLHLTTGLTLLTTTTLIDLTNTIDTTSNREIWKGWDTSLAWWAAAFGQRDDLVNIFFTLRTAPHQSQPLPGLGLAIARYNAGASSSNIINPSNTRMIVSPSTIPSRLISGFWLRWTYSSPSPPSWNWSTDPNQRAMLSKATARGANILELFSNSSMWWTCKNHNPSGSDGGKSDNVQSWNHRNHAVYLATIAKYASENWGSEVSER